MNHKLIWKYRSIKNPYISPNTAITSVLNGEDDPIMDTPDILPIAPEYMNEICHSNHILAFERDGWKCSKRGSRKDSELITSSRFLKEHSTRRSFIESRIYKRCVALATTAYPSPDAPALDESTARSPTSAMPSGMYNNPIEKPPMNEKTRRSIVPIQETAIRPLTSPTATATPVSNGRSATGAGVRTLLYVDVWTQGLPTVHCSDTTASEEGSPTSAMKTESAITIPATTSAALVIPTSMPVSEKRQPTN
jgi:hypothetical protein